VSDHQHDDAKLPEWRDESWRVHAHEYAWKTLWISGALALGYILAVIIGVLW